MFSGLVIHDVRDRIRWPKMLVVIQEKQAVVVVVVVVVVAVVVGEEFVVVGFVGSDDAGFVIEWVDIFLN